MADNTLEIVLTAETEQATKNIQNATKAITALDKTAKSAKGLDGLSKSAANATPTLTNFSRVLSDAPFGIIGIANNIDPLISSFQSLSKQAGGTGGALKSLFAGLAGPAGIAVGVSAVTSALIAFGPQIGDAIAGISALDKAQQEAGAKGAEAFAKANDQFSNFLRLATDSGNSLARQNDAFENANKLLDDYGLKINSLADFQKNGTQIGALYAQIKQEEAKATILAGKAAEAYAKQVAIGIKAQQGDISILSDFSFGDIANAILGSVNGPAGVATATVDGYTNALQKAKDEEKLFNAETQNIRTGIDGLIKQLKGVGGVTEDFGKKVKVTKQTAAELNQELGLNQQLLTGYISSVDAQGNEFLQLAAAIAKATEAQNKKNIADKAAATIAAARGTQQAPADLAKNVGIPTTITQAQAENAAIVAAQVERLQLATENTNAAFALLSPSINQAFDALANGENATEALGQAIKQLIVQLIKAVVQAAILAAIMNAIAPGSSAAKGGFLGIFKGLLGFRANGGPVQGGGPYVVGENGPELFVPSTQGNIVPNMALAGAGAGNVSFEIRGDVLYGLLRRTQNNRNGNF